MPTLGATTSFPHFNRTPTCNLKIKYIFDCSYLREGFTILCKINNMEIIFNVPSNDFDPMSIHNGFVKIPNKPGVYIWGYWIWIHGKKTFCPMNVGEAGKGTGNLRTRLIQHYCTHFENKDDGTAAFFEVNKYMSQTAIDDLYKQLGVYNDLPTRGEKRMKDIKLKMMSKELERLIFYQNKAFFDFEINTENENIGVYSLIQFLERYKKNDKLLYGELLNKIIERQEVHFNNFFCIYATLESNVNGEKRKMIENTVNHALRKKLGIATIANRKNVFDKSIKINLKAIKNILVKISENTNYINRQGNYDSNLTIDIK